MRKQKLRMNLQLFADPNSGQISAYPTFASKYASTSVITVERSRWAAVGTAAI